MAANKESFKPAKKVLDKSSKVWYNKDNQREEAIRCERWTMAANKESFEPVKKVLDKAGETWYNIDNQRKETVRCERWKRRQRTR